MAMTASATTAAILVLVALVMMAAEGAGKGAAAPPPVDCTSVVLSMSDCLSYVTNGSDVQKPEGGCCSGLKSVLKTNPDCLCKAFQQSADFGVVLNVSKALALPDACHVHAPSATKCGLSVSPAGAPAGAAVAPAGAPSSSSIANAPSGAMGGSETAPAAAPASKTGSSSMISVSGHLVVLGIGAAFISSF